MLNNKNSMAQAMQDLAASITNDGVLQNPQVNALPKKKEVVGVVDLTLPWFLDHRECNPLRKEFLEFRAELKIKYREAQSNIVKPVEVKKVMPVSPYQKKKAMKDRLNKGRLLVIEQVQKIKIGDVVSGRKLKAQFIGAITDSSCVVETDYERVIRALVKVRKIRKCGRSYERIY
tara:strand:- start:1081 stop:1605 length:525 start_codon:yes stop_codon:yes gene_type:complete